jgi:hypothetical protein
MRRRILLASLALMAVMSPSGIGAAPTAEEAGLAAYMAAPEFKTNLAAALIEAEPARLKASCQDYSLIRANEVTIIEPPVFEAVGDSKRMTSGSWIVVAHLDRCGQEVRRRMLLRMDGSDHWIKTYPLLPGDFRGNLKLEIDARSLVATALAAKGHCADVKKIEVLDVVNKQPPDDQGWSETWNVDACGTLLNIEMRYTRDAEGVKISGAVGLPP